MGWHYTHYVWPFLASALVCFSLMRYAWPRRDVPASLPFIILTGIAGLWSTLSAVQMLAVGLPAKAFLADLRYVASTTLPVAWLAFALAQSGRGHRLTPRLLSTLIAIPAIIVLLVATNDRHGLMFRATELVLEGPTPSVGRVYGPGFWLCIAHGYSLMLAGASLIGWHHLAGPILYRRQAGVMLAGVLVAFAMNVAFITSPGRFAHIDWTPVAFAVSGLFFAWGLYRFHLLDLMPVAGTTTIESLPDGVVIFDARGLVLDLNPAAERLFGQPASTAAGRSLAELTGGIDLMDLPGEEAASPREVVLSVAGERRTYEWRQTPLHTHLHRSHRRLAVGLLRDVTDRKRAEIFEAGQRSILELIATGVPLPEVLTALIRFTQELDPADVCCAVFVMDDAGEWLSCIAAPDLPSDYIAAVGAVPVAPLAGSCGAAAYHGQAVLADDLATDPRWADNGAAALRYGFAACRSMPIHATQGDILGTFDTYYSSRPSLAVSEASLFQMAAHLAGIAIERHRFENHLIRAKEHAETMARMKSAFLANMSHEIRTPLTSIIGFADLLAGELDDEYKLLATRIEQGGKRLLATLNSVLDYARIEAGKVEIRLQPLDVVEVARETVDFFLPRTQSKPVALELEAPVEPVLAHLDRGCLIRVLNNLVENALKFTDEGRIVLAVHARDEQVEIQVQDTGCGISEDFLPLVFDEFQQESRGLARRHDGSGLGLRITKRLVEHMHGQIEVSSRKGTGSTFTILFPPFCQMVPRSDRPAQPAALHAPRAPGSSSTA